MGSKVYGLIGRRLKHSYSGPIHRELGNSAYRLIELEPEELEMCIRDRLPGNHPGDLRPNDKSPTRNSRIPYPRAKNCLLYTS